MLLVAFGNIEVGGGFVAVVLAGEYIYGIQRDKLVKGRGGWDIVVMTPIALQATSYVDRSGHCLVSI